MLGVITVPGRPLIEHTAAELTTIVQCSTQGAGENSVAIYHYEILQPRTHRCPMGAITAGHALAALAFTLWHAYHKREGVD